MNRNFHFDCLGRGSFISIVLIFFILIGGRLGAQSREEGQAVNFRVSFAHPETHRCEVEMRIRCKIQDTLLLKMPCWMPGYYQIMDYASSVIQMEATDEKGHKVNINKCNDHTWVLTGIHNQSLTLRYTLQFSKQFVANSYVDSLHAYLIPENTFLYPEGYLAEKVGIKIFLPAKWAEIATGLNDRDPKANEFIAEDFNILYDCPILAGNLEHLPSFYIQGREHRFISYQLGDFDKNYFIKCLEQTVKAATDIIGDIPYSRYTFLTIGPGRGGIEHLNNTTVSLDGNQLKTPIAIRRTMNFLGHEYFHHYNVKRIRPLELGPFDYEKENRTNLLWVSEGLSVYYEYMIVKRAGLIDGPTLLSYFAENMNAHENNPGRHYQSLQQASYQTWSDGPFGTQGNEPGKAISYYDKGPLVGLMLDFRIRHETANTKSLDDVMRFLYQEYYRKKQRGFTEAEFQQACEWVAGVSLSEFFTYIYTTRELDYDNYLANGGLKLIVNPVDSGAPSGKQNYLLSVIENPDTLQAAILKSWLGE